MQWKKHGLIFTSDNLPHWADHSALTPTPYVRFDGRVRVYAGFRTNDGVSRIGYADLDADDPTRLIGVSQTPVLDIGRNGCFDDNGCIMGHVMRVDDALRMYYIGFQNVAKAKFLAFTGLAISKDGDIFERVQETPLLDRLPGSAMIHALHSAERNEIGWTAWVARGDDWEIRKGAPFPRYDIWQIESPDGVNFDVPGRRVVALEGTEYRIGRPSIFRHPDGRLHMFYTIGYKDSDSYRAGLAISSDGIDWQRNDDAIGLFSTSETAFDARHLCYPRIFETQGKTWAVYNGNDMGREGFCLAELLSW